MQFRQLAILIVSSLLTLWLTELQALYAILLAAVYCAAT